jgi:hypothetical protein
MRRFHLRPTTIGTDRVPRGQVAVIFAGAMLLFALLCAAVVDLSWYWTNNLRMQRAADAAALAGVVFLPGDPTSAINVARSEAVKNGYTNGSGGVTVTPSQDPSNPRRLRVTISGPVGTFFARAVGISSWPARRDAKAEYVLPVPMGSPENYYGVFGLVRHPGGGVTVTDTDTGVTSYFDPSSVPGGNWTNPTNAYVDEPGATPNVATKNSTTNPYQIWGGFGASLPSGGTVTIDGIEVEVEAKSTDSSGCTIQAALNWDGNNSPTSGNWTSVTRTVNLTNNYTYLQFGGATDTWGRSWSTGNLSNSNFRIRLRYVDPGAACTDASTTSLDHVHVRIYWTQTTSTFIPDTNLTGPAGQALNPRGFWATMLTQGADDVNGDAYLPQNEQGGGDSNPEYSPSKYYDYAVEMPSTANGSVYVYDPVFCATASNGQYGTGDRWFGSATPTSSFFELWDTRNTPYDLGDDTRVDPTGDDTLFRRIQASDPTLNGPAVGGSTADCSPGATSNQGDGRYWHLRWWPLATGLPGGTTYRVRTRTTDPNSPSDQASANGENSFAIWASSGKVFGIGAMQSFSPLPGAATSEFYLAQIDAVHAGKTVVISLWDPGDTGSLTGSLAIRIPGAGGYTSASLNYTAAKGTTNSNASNCNGTSGSGTSINTHASGSQRFNGCWVTIEIAIPLSYTAPTPPGETEPGWWKIAYTMSGAASDTSLDVTTWQVAIRGNPVHLVLP